MFLGCVLSLSAFTSLMPLYSPKIASRSPNLPGGQFNVTNLVGWDSKIEYVSDKLGTNTAVKFDFRTPARIVGFRHVDRNDPATVAESELEFYDDGGQLRRVLPVKHVNKRAGETLFILPKPVTARRVKWRITKLGSGTEPAVGDAELAFLFPQAMTYCQSAIESKYKFCRFGKRGKVSL